MTITGGCFYVLARKKSLMLYYHLTKSYKNSMDYMSREEVMAIWNANINLTDEELLAMKEDEFRARVRERCHHTLEIQAYHAQHRDKKLSIFWL